MPFRKRPLIGINLDYQTTQTFSQYPWYALRENYFSATALHGGIPIALPYHIDLIDSYLDLTDGLIIPGGRFDISPNYYEEKILHAKTEINAVRTHFEYNLCKRSLERNIPLLGICGGMQLINVVLGGTLIQYIPDALPCALNHDQETVRHETVHSINIVPGTRLAHIYPHKDAQVNSSHRQAIDCVASSGIIMAHAPDSIIEAIEFPEYKFCLGVQWHPEFLLTDLDNHLFSAFISACILNV